MTRVFAGTAPRARERTAPPRVTTGARLLASCPDAGAVIAWRPARETRSRLWQRYTGPIEPPAEGLLLRAWAPGKDPSAVVHVPVTAFAAPLTPAPTPEA